MALQVPLHQGPLTLMTASNYHCLEGLWGQKGVVVNANEACGTIAASDKRRLECFDNG